MSSSAIIPFRANGAAADQNAPHRFIQVGPLSLHIKQCSQKANALRVPGDSLQDGEDTMNGGDGPSGGVQWPHEDSAAASAGNAQLQGPGVQMQALNHPRQDSRLVNVGMVVWQSGFVLAELLMRKPPLGPWTGVKVLDLGSGTGITGIALALAGAQVALTDLPHILPLTQENVATNCRPIHRAVVAEHSWGSDATPLLQLFGGPPDVITAADCIYETQFHGSLMATLQQCMGSHSVAYFSYRNRTAKEQSFAATAASCGFAVEAVPVEQLAEDFQTGGYCVLRLARIDGVCEHTLSSASWSTPSLPVVESLSVPETRVHVGNLSEAPHLEPAMEEEPEHRPCLQS